jgi:hypothetical protein
MYKALENLYSQVLISEMNQSVIDYIENHKEQLPFHDIFGDKLRIVIPLSPDEIGLEIINALSKIEGYEKITRENEVSRKIKLDPKYGKGDYKVQLIAVGKAIQSLKIPNDLKSKYLDWYALHKDSLFELQYADYDVDILNKYVIVLSRAPVDIVRMSDGDWGFSPGTRERSCHNRMGSFFECALQEAISGGAIAFLVKKEDIQDAIDNDRFQESDLFKDPDRGITGPEATARLRIRMLDVHMPNETDEDNIQQIAVPETRIYGNSVIPNFYRTVKNYIRKVQPYSADELMNAIGEGGPSRISIRGGTQKDNNMDTLLNKLYDNKYEFNPNIYHNKSDMSSEGDLDIDDIDDEVDREALAEEERDQLENELSYIENRYFSGNHSSVGYYTDIIDDEEAYVYYDAHGKLTISLDSDYETDSDFQDEIDSWGIRKLRLKNTDDSEIARYGVKGEELRKLKKFIQALDQYDPTGELLDLTDQIQNHSSDELVFVLKFNYGNGSSSDPSDYKDFIEDVVNMLDENYDDIKKAVQKALAVSGYIENESSGVDYTEYKNAQELLDELEHIGFKNNVIQIGMSIPIDRRNVITLKGFDDEVSEAMGNFLVNYLTKEYKQSVNKPEQLEFSKLYESFDSPSLKKFGIYDVDGTLESNDMIAGSYIELSINLDVLGLNLGVINLMQFLDKNFKDIQNVGAIIVYQLLLDKGGYVEEGYLNRLKHVYGQYMQPM